MQTEKKSVVFVLGGPGCGKGTQCSQLVKSFGYVHLSAGDLLREEVIKRISLKKFFQIKKQSERGKMIETIIKDGRIVPSEITVELLKIAIDSSPAKNSMFIIDGFPRNQENYDVWEKIIGKSIELKFVLVLDCSYKAMEQRVLKRAKSEARSDDNLETLKRRFDTFEKETIPIIKLYETQKMVKKINAERSIEEIFADVKSLF